MPEVKLIIAEVRAAATITVTGWTKGNFNKNE